MAGRPRKVTSITEEIAKQEELVAKAKAKYDAESKKLKALLAKQEEQKKKELFTAVEKSGKSYDEIFKFLNGEA